MLVTCQRFGDLFLFGLVWQYIFYKSEPQYNKGRFKVMATYLQQLYNFEPQGRRPWGWQGCHAMHGTPRFWQIS